MSELEKGLEREGEREQRREGGKGREGVCVRERESETEIESRDTVLDDMVFHQNLCVCCVCVCLCASERARTRESKREHASASVCKFFDRVLCICTIIRVYVDTVNGQVFVYILHVYTILQ